MKATSIKRTALTGMAAIALAIAMVPAAAFASTADSGTPMYGPDDEGITQNSVTSVGSVPTVSGSVANAVDVATAGVADETLPVVAGLDIEKADDAARAAAEMSANEGASNVVSTGASGAVIKSEPVDTMAISVEWFAVALGAIAIALAIVGIVLAVRKRAQSQQPVYSY